jgi:hypothetical protein
MAKLTGPLLSFDARGKLGNTLVFIGWKGIKTVRQFVIPANPNTPGQVAQRDNMTMAVARWKPLQAATKAAWAAATAIATSPLSGFNLFCRSAIAILINDPDGPIGDYMSIVPGVGTITISGILSKVSDGTPVTASADFTAYLGSNIRNITTPLAWTWTPGTSNYIAAFPALPAGVPQYAKIVHGPSGLDVTGIFVATPT